MAAATPQEQSKTDHAIVTQADAERKAAATLAARAAMLGATLHRLAGGGYLLTRWALSRECDTLAEVEAAPQRMVRRA